MNRTVQHTEQHRFLIQRLFQIMAPKIGMWDMLCIPAPYAPGAVCQTRLESSIVCVKIPVRVWLDYLATVALTPVFVWLGSTDQRGLELALHQRRCLPGPTLHCRAERQPVSTHSESKWLASNIWIRDVFCSQHLCWRVPTAPSKNTSRIQILHLRRWV